MERPVVRLLKARGDIKGLIDALYYFRDDGVRSRAAEALGELKASEAVPQLIRALVDPAPSIRESAAKALGMIGDARATGHLIRALGDEWEVHRAAVKALEGIGTPAVEALLRNLEFLKTIRPVYPRNGVMGGVIEALGGIGDRRAVEPLMEALKDESSLVREKAAAALGRIGDKRAVDPLIHALTDEDRDVRSRAAWALGQIGDTRAVKPLVKGLTDKNYWTRQQVALALDRLGWKPRGKEEEARYLCAVDRLEEAGKLGGAAAEPLLHVLMEGDEETQWVAAEALKSVGAAVVKPIIQALREGNEIVEEYAAEILGVTGEEGAELLITALGEGYQPYCKIIIEALGKIGDPRAIEPLKRMLDDEDAGIREAAAKALDRLGWKPEDKTEKARYLVAKRRWKDVVSLGEAAAAPLIRALRTPLEGWDDEYPVQSQAEDALISIGLPAVNHLIRALKSKDCRIRRRAAGALGCIGEYGNIKDKEVEDRVVEALCEALHDEDSDIREQAAKALGKIGNGKAVDSLIQALKDPTPEVRYAAKWALEYIDAPASKFVHALKDEDRLVRRTAAFAIAERGDSLANKLLFKILRNGNRDERVRAARALGKTGDLRAVEVLISLLNEKDRVISEAAVEALGELGDPRAIKPLLDILRNEIHQTGPSSNVAKALGKLKSEEALDFLLQKLKDKDSSTKCRAAYRLGQLGDARAVEPLIQALQDESHHVRACAAKALGLIGSPRAIEPLLQALRDHSQVRKAAAYALQGLGWKPRNGREAAYYLAALGSGANEITLDADSVKPLLEAITWRETEYRIIVAALGKIRDEKAVEHLIDALQDEDPRIRMGAAAALSAIGDPRAVDALAERLLHDEEILVRRAAAEALHKLAWKPKSDAKKAHLLIELGRWSEVEKLGSAAVEPLIRTLKSSDQVGRENAAETLGKIGDPRAIQPLLLALEDPRSSVVKSAARALGEIGCREAVEPLLRILQGKNNELIATAIEVLGKMGERCAVAPIIQALDNTNISGTARIALEELKGPETIRQLIQALQHKSWRIRRGAAAVLGRIRALEAAEALTQALMDEMEEVREAAERALENIEMFRQKLLNKQDEDFRLMRRGGRSRRITGKHGKDLSVKCSNKGCNTSFAKKEEKTL